MGLMGSMGRTNGRGEGPRLQGGGPAATLPQGGRGCRKAFTHHTPKQSAFLSLWLSGWLDLHSRQLLANVFLEGIPSLSSVPSTSS